MSNKDKGYGPRDYALTDTYIEQEVNGIRQRVHMCISFERVHAPKFYIGGRSTALIEKAEHEAALSNERDACEALAKVNDEMWRDKLAEKDERIKELEAVIEDQLGDSAYFAIRKERDTLRSQNAKLEKALQDEIDESVKKSQYILVLEEKLERARDILSNTPSEEGVTDFGIQQGLKLVIYKALAALTKQRDLSKGEN